MTIFDLILLLTGLTPPNNGAIIDNVSFCTLSRINQNFTKGSNKYLLPGQALVSAILIRFPKQGRKMT